MELQPSRFPSNTGTKEMSNSTLVTAVIPTKNRPELVIQAVHSALAQSYRNIEVVVVVDGPDPATEHSLSQFADSRLHVVVLPVSEGAAQARNAGVIAATGQWIAFLDDDDVWLPDKTEMQMAAVGRSRHGLPVVSCRFFAHTEHGEYIWPRRLPAQGEDISEYLFSRRSIFQGEGFLATPTILARRELLLKVPLRSHLKKHEDWDWLIRVAKQEGVGFEFAAEPLATVQVSGNRERLSNSDDWRSSLDWIREMRGYVSPRAYSAFVLTVVADQASRQATLAEYLTLPRESWRTGTPELFQFLLYAGMRVFPRSARHNLRERFMKRA